MKPRYLPMLLAVPLVSTVPALAAEGGVSPLQRPAAESAEATAEASTGAGEQPGAESAEPAAAPTAEERHFRIGLHGYGTFDHFGDDHAALKIGAGLVLPHFDVIIEHGLGLRLGFVVEYHQAAGGNVQSTGELSGVDITWYDEPGDPSTERTERVDAWVFSYGMSINFKYEVTVPPSDPAYRFFRWVQPYVGTGICLLWTRTHTDLPTEYAVLINNEAYRGADAYEYDPWSIQIGPGYNLFGGFHFNVAETFRINLEVGYFLVDVPGGEEEARLKYATEGHNAHHEPYKINDLKLGGGVEFVF